MKKYIFITLFGILFTSCSVTNKEETRNLERFDKVNLVGNVELHLERNSNHSIEIVAKNTSDMADLITEVRNGELYVYNEKSCGNCKNSKYIIYLNHSGISGLNMTGVITLISEDKINQKDLVISGDGILNGNLEVSVTNLSVNLKGLSNINISGYAATSNLKVTGIGMINAAKLKTKSSKNVSKGITMINK
ncbi:GIN domain-containing protein [Aquimarina aquimarini]|uniref:GIN domain-containing protein n=1 Tax=Aquimarina aquimarini TaxID=1191734 RepID=UPI000D5616CD|nr:DUF2807 domain-containing protein [Aquimarina aquimarini]